MFILKIFLKITKFYNCKYFKEIASKINMLAVNSTIISTETINYINYSKLNYDYSQGIYTFLHIHVICFFIIMFTTT
jgi:hypothetical protein